jgi:hypothetical protein
MPDDGLGVIVLTNQHCADGMINAWPDKVARNIYDHLLHGSVTGKLSLPSRMAPHAAFYAADAAPLAAPVVAPPR